MKLTQLNTLEVGRRVQGFLDAHAAAIGSTILTSLRAKLDLAVQQLAGCQVEQATAVFLWRRAARAQMRSERALTFARW